MVIERLIAHASTESALITPKESRRRPTSPTRSCCFNGVGAHHAEGGQVSDPRSTCPQWLQRSRRSSRRRSRKPSDRSAGSGTCFNGVGAHHAEGGLGAK